jgi:hypothetical protein
MVIQYKRHIVLTFLSRISCWDYIKLGPEKLFTKLYKIYIYIVLLTIILVPKHVRKDVLLEGILFARLIPILVKYLQNLSAISFRSKTILPSILVNTCQSIQHPQHLFIYLFTCTFFTKEVSVTKSDFHESPLSYTT